MRYFQLELLHGMCSVCFMHGMSGTTAWGYTDNNTRRAGGKHKKHELMQACRQSNYPSQHAHTRTHTVLEHNGIKYYAYSRNEGFLHNHSLSNSYFKWLGSTQEDGSRPGPKVLLTNACTRKKRGDGKERQFMGERKGEGEVGSTTREEEEWDGASANRYRRGHFPIHKTGPDEGRECWWNFLLWYLLPCRTLLEGSITMRFFSPSRQRDCSRPSKPVNCSGVSSYQPLGPPSPPPPPGYSLHPWLFLQKEYADNTII